MSYWTKERQGTMQAGGGREPGIKGSAKKGKMKVKPAFKTGVPGQTGPNRSAGVKKVKQHPHDEGL